MNYKSDLDLNKRPTTLYNKCAQYKCKQSVVKQELALLAQLALPVLHNKHARKSKGKIKQNIVN